jgi:hypothetical protein
VIAKPITKKNTPEKFLVIVKNVILFPVILIAIGYIIKSSFGNKIIFYDSSTKLNY